MNMKHNLYRIFICFFIVFTALMLLLYFKASPNMDDKLREDVVALNEIKALAKLAVNTEDNVEVNSQVNSQVNTDTNTVANTEVNINSTYDKLADRIDALQNKLLTEANQYSGKRNAGLYIGIYLTVNAFLLALFIYTYLSIIKPFDRLSIFASEVANGNFDFPLKYERRNLFGAFTWAFDNMRREIKKARACEKEAIENNKTVIATISHDIKTPIASIRAYAEGLQANMDSNLERRQRYLSVIMNKCDEVSKLTNDLFLHSLSDLNKLKMNPVSCKAGEVLSSILETAADNKESVHVLSDIPDVLLYIDIRRLEQVFENLIGNALKYGGNKGVDILFETDNKLLKCHFRDYGEGIANEDMPFIFDKFYRGKNTSHLPGAGLGLYIAQYILNQMDGNITLNNCDNGLDAVIELPINNFSSI